MGGTGPRVTRRVLPTMLWDTVGVFPTTLPDSDMFINDNRRCDDFCAWFLMNKMINVYLEQMSVLHMAVRRRSSEEVYTGCNSGVFV